MKNITEYLKESLINEVSDELLTRAAEKARSMQGAKYKRLANEFEKWRDSHEREANMIKQAAKDAGNNKNFNYVPKSRNELIECLINLIKQRGQDADLNDIDVSNITNMFAVFDNRKFNIRNIDISKWDVSNVEDMSCMFYECKEFNCDLSKWDVSNVKTMVSMFAGCTNFNCDLSKWNVSNVKYMDGMFYKSGIKDIPSWAK